MTFRTLTRNKNLAERVYLFIYNNIHQLILYGIIGSFCAGLDFITFYILTIHIGVYYLIANLLSVSIGITSSFFLNRRFNFKIKDKIIRRFISFFIVGISGLILSSLLLVFFVESLLLTEIISKVFSMLFVVLMQFLLNKYVTFKK